MSREFDLSTWRQDRSAVRRFEEEERNGVEADDPAPLSGLFTYLADGYEKGRLAERAAAFLLLISPHSLGGDTCAEIADRLGVPYARFQKAIRDLREEMPDVNGGYSPSRMSRNRRRSLCEIRQIRRNARLRVAELSALRAIETQTERYRVARSTLQLATALQKHAALEMAALDKSFRLDEDPPSQSCLVSDLPAAEAAFERARAEIVARRSARSS